MKLGTWLFVVVKYKYFLMKMLHVLVCCDNAIFDSVGINANANSFYFYW